MPWNKCFETIPAPSVTKNSLLTNAAAAAAAAESTSAIITICGVDVPVNSPLHRAAMCYAKYSGTISDPNDTPITVIPKPTLHNIQDGYFLTAAVKMAASRETEPVPVYGYDILPVDELERPFIAPVPKPVVPRKKFTDVEQANFDHPVWKLSYDERVAQNRARNSSSQVLATATAASLAASASALARARASMPAQYIDMAADLASRTDDSNSMVSPDILQVPDLSHDTERTREAGMVVEDNDAFDTNPMDLTCD